MMIYVVTEGDYSDYHIAAVFTDKALAERFAETHAAVVEEHETDLTAWIAPPGLAAWCGMMLHDGSMSPLWDENPRQFSPPAAGLGRGRIVTPMRGPSWLDFEVWATDAQHAIKIANERRAQAIASGEWP